MIIIRDKNYTSIENQERIYSLLGNFRNKLGDRILGKAIKTDKEISKLTKEISEIKNSNQNLFNRLKEFAENRGIIINIKNKSYQRGQEISLSKEDPLILAHELGHLLNSEGNWITRKISNLNNNSCRKTYNTLKIHIVL